MRSRTKGRGTSKTKGDNGFNTSEECCALCRLSTNDPDQFGEMVTLKQHNLTVHYFCLLTSCGVYQRGEEDEGIFGFLVDDIKQEISRSSRLTCVACKKKGASVGCFVKRCRRKVHFPCGKKQQFIFQFTDLFQSYCKDHSPTQSFPVSSDLSLPQSCSICLDTIEPVLSYSILKCPACHTSWFHRDCVQHQAHSAGLFFFRCTLCNNKDQFQDEMLRMGIHIPERDASWELEENAFEELLEVYQRCDALECVCINGRSHSAKTGWFEVLRCALCGSRGTHRKCSGLKSDANNWACEDCTEAVDGRASLVPSASPQSGGQRRSLLSKRRLSSIHSPISSKRPSLSDDASPEEILQALALQLISPKNQAQACSSPQPSPNQLQSGPLTYSFPQPPIESMIHLQPRTPQRQPQTLFCLQPIVPKSQPQIQSPIRSMVWFQSQTPSSHPRHQPGSPRLTLLSQPQSQTPTSQPQHQPGSPRLTLLSQPQSQTPTSQPQHQPGSPRLTLLSQPQSQSPTSQPQHQPGSPRLTLLSQPQSQTPTSQHQPGSPRLTLLSQPQSQTPTSQPQYQPRSPRLTLLSQPQSQTPTSQPQHQPGSPRLTLLSQPQSQTPTSQPQYQPRSPRLTLLSHSQFQNLVLLQTKSQMFSPQQQLLSQQACQLMLLQQLPSPHTQPTSQSHTQPTSQSHTQPPSQPSSQPSAQSHTQPTSQSHTQPTSQSHTQPTSQSHTHPTSQSHTQPPSQPSSQPSAQSHTQPPSQLQPSTKSHTQLTSQSSPQPPSQPQPSTQSPSQHQTSTQSHTQSPSQPQPSTLSRKQPSTRSRKQPSTRSRNQPATQSHTQPRTQIPSLLHQRRISSYFQSRSSEPQPQPSPQPQPQISPSLLLQSQTPDLQSTPLSLRPECQADSAQLQLHSAFPQLQLLSCKPEPHTASPPPSPQPQRYPPPSPQPQRNSPPSPQPQRYPPHSPQLQRYPRDPSQLQHPPQAPPQLQHPPQAPPPLQRPPQAPPQLQHPPQAPPPLQCPPQAPSQLQHPPQAPPPLQRPPQAPSQLQRPPQAPPQLQHPPQAPPPLQRPPQAPSQLQHPPQAPPQTRLYPHLWPQRISQPHPLTVSLQLQRMRQSQPQPQTPSPQPNNTPQPHPAPQLQLHAPSNPVLVTGDQALSAGLSLVKRNNFNPTHCLSVRFQDGHKPPFPSCPGGVSAKCLFLKLLVEQIQESVVFEGPPGAKNLSLDSQALREDLYFEVGCLLAVSLVHGGPPLGFFSPALYQCLFNYPRDTPLTVTHITHSHFAQRINRIAEASSLEDLKETVEAFGECLELAGCNRPISTLEDKHGLVEDLVSFTMITRMQLPLQRFREGLRTLGVFEQVQMFPAVFYRLFCGPAERLTAETLVGLFTVTFSEQQERQDRETLVVSFWRHLLVECEVGRSSVSLQDILLFSTGADAVPALGFQPPPSLSFIHPLSPAEERGRRGAGGSAAGGLGEKDGVMDVCFPGEERSRASRREGRKNGDRSREKRGGLRSRGREASSPVEEGERDDVMDVSPEGEEEEMDGGEGVVDRPIEDRGREEKMEEGVREEWMEKGVFPQSWPGSNQLSLPVVASYLAFKSSMEQAISHGDRPARDTNLDI